MEYCNVKLTLKAPENQDPSVSFNGKVTFNPDIGRGETWHDNGVLVPSVRVDAAIVDNVLQGSDGKKLIKLMAGGAGVNPEQVYWRIAFDDIYLGEQRVHIDPFIFEAIPGETLDLEKVTPVAGYTPPGVIRGEKGDPGFSFKGAFNKESELPTSNKKGDAWVNLSTKDLYVWNGSKWEVVTDFGKVEFGLENINNYVNQAEQHALSSKNHEEGSKAHAADSLSYAKRAELAAEETIQQVEGDFATRSYADSKNWHKGPITNDHVTMADVGVGAWNIAARTHAVRLGLPMDYGSLQVMTIGASKTAFFIGQTTGMWINASSGTTWGEWQNISDPDEVSVENGTSGLKDGSSGLKTVAMALTAGSVLDGVPGRYRVLTHITAPVVRWRIHVESRRLVYSTTRAFTIGNVYVGNHAGNGVMTNMHQIKSGSLSVAAGDEWVSPWMDADLLSDEAMVDLEVAGSGLFSSQATSWVYEKGKWVSSKNSPVSIWAELETYDQVPVVGMIGDSTGCGQGADRPVYESALYIAARKYEFIPMSYAYPGSSLQSMSDYDLHIYQRWAHLDSPDSVIIQSGSNDIHAGTSASEMKTRFEGLVEIAKLISPVIIGATVKARYPNSGAHQAVLNTHNDFVKTRANGNRDYLDFYQAVSPSGTIAAADAADAAHLSTSGHQKLATAFDGITVSRSAWVDTAKELDVKADKTYVDKRVPIDSFTGTGSPEGRLEAPVGSMYTDSAATAGAIRWVKTSGAENTGWKVEYGDTGWRLITNRGESQTGEIYIRRVVNTCYIRVYKYLDPGNYAKHIATIPVGFRPEGAFYGLIVDPNAGSTNSIIGSYSTGALSWTRDIDGGHVRPSSAQSGEITYYTPDAWPTSLPGTPI